MQNTYLQWDVPAIVEKMGGPTELHRRIAATGAPNPPGIFAVKKWVTRGSIPSDWLAVIFGIAKQSKRPIDAYAVLKTPPADAAPTNDAGEDLLA